jgi:hypothetical protein
LGTSGKNVGPPTLPDFSASSSSLTRAALYRSFRGGVDGPGAANRTVSISVPARDESLIDAALVG